MNCKWFWCTATTCRGCWSCAPKSASSPRRPWKRSRLRSTSEAIKRNPRRAPAILGVHITIWERHHGFHLQRPDWPDHPGARYLGDHQCAQGWRGNGSESPVGAVDSSVASAGPDHLGDCRRSEEHTSELQSLMRISYAVFCLKKKNM